MSYRGKTIKHPALYLESAGDYSIRNEYGTVVSVEDARKLWESGTLEDWNLAFARLAQRCNFDVEAVKREYAAMGPR